jgi:transcriptional regulator with XRE-family HTH domain
MVAICRKSPQRLMRIEDVRALLAVHCKMQGGQSAFARKHGLTRAYVSQVLAGQRPPSPRLCKGLGLREDGQRWVRK